MLSGVRRCGESVLLLQIKDELFNKYEVSKVSIALSFIYTMPFNITPVVGVSSIAHLNDAMIAMNIKLTKKEWYKLYLLGKHKLP